MNALAPARRSGRYSMPATRSRSWLSDARMDLPFTALVIAVALTLVAHGYSLARIDAPLALPFYWSGLALMVVVPAWRLMQPNLTRRDRLSIVLVLGVALYMAKVMQHPLTFAYHDEHAHWRSALDIVRTGKLFNVNPLLPVTPLYPGLAVATAAISELSGLDLHLSSLLLLTAARVVFMLALFHLFEAATRSERAAGLGTAIYAINPNFLYFDAQFSYETLALPLAVMLVYAVLRSQAEGENANIPGLSLIAALTVASNAMTHHFTSYMTILFLLGWGVVGLVLRKHRHNRPSSLNIAVLALLINLFWLLYVANFTLSYLAYVFVSAFQSLANAAGAGGSIRRPFEAADAAAAPPLYQRLLGFASVGFTMAGIPFAVWEVWRRHRTRAILIAMAAAAMLQPAMYVLRLTPSGWEISNRSAEFIFLGLAPTVALAVFNLSFPKWLDGIRRWIVPPALAIMLAGGVIVSSATWMLLPWPYQAGSDQRSIELQGVAAAEWSEEFLGPDRRYIADRVNAQLWSTHGRQFLAYVDGHPILPGLILSPRFDDYSRKILADSRLEYVVADMRFSEQKPAYDYYIAENEKLIYGTVNPLPRASLEKYDNIADVQRIFDSGGIVVYDVRRLAHAR